jgi:hypothetical protein
MFKIGLLTILFSGVFTVAYCQVDSISDIVDSNETVPAIKPTEVFRATRIIDGSSVANLNSGVLDFIIGHRFGQLNQGSQNFFGLDDATTRIALDYGITRWLMVGLGHSVLNKEDDGTMKIAVLRQKQCAMPLSVSYAGALSVQTAPAPALPAGDSWQFNYRLYYTNQLLIARKFGDRLSLQVMPTILHYNIVDRSNYSNNTMAVGVGGRIKLTKRIAVTGEYYYRLNNADMLYNGLATYNALSVGMEITSGGHVFQLMLTNAQGLTEHAFIGQTTDSWSKGGLHFGFNISRTFTIIKHKEL